VNVASLQLMPAEVSVLDLASLGIASGGGRRLDLPVRIGELTFGEERYAADPALVDAILEVSRLHGQGWALRLRFRAGVRGPCVRCLKEARPEFEVDAREVSVPGGSEELTSPYVDSHALDLSSWARDAVVLALPTKILCREDCAGLCPVCARDLNEVVGEHRHDAPPDPRWEKLRGLLR
jgi:uncharacterized protein